MKEVTDEIELGRLRSIVQSTPFFDNPSIGFSLYRAFYDEHWGEHTSVQLYRIEIRSSESVMFCGLLSMPDGHVYLDWIATKVLVLNMIQSELDAFNAGHHWRYKGL